MTDLVTTAVLGIPPPHPPPPSPSVGTFSVVFATLPVLKGHCLLYNPTLGTSCVDVCVRVRLIFQGVLLFCDVRGSEWPLLHQSKFLM